MSFWWLGAIQDFAMSLFFVWLVYRASIGFSGISGQILSARPVVYLGKISYGIYLYHLFAYAIVQYVVFARPRGVDRAYLDDNGIDAYIGLDLIAIITSLTILMAVLSWHLFEKPILGLRAR